MLWGLVEASEGLVVVDLGSGTGLSTRIWESVADEVVGVEPNPVMRRFSEHATSASSVRYVEGSAFSTGLPDASASLVTASQSLQWEDPERAFPEIGRILKPNGVFCAYQYEDLLTPAWRPEAVWKSMRSRRHDLLSEYGLLDSQRRWPVSIDSFEKSGVFRHTREMVMHSVEAGDGDRLIGFALSEGWVTTLLEAGASEEEIGVDQLRTAASEMPEPIPWWISYRAWLGIK